MDVKGGRVISIIKFLKKSFSYKVIAVWLLVILIVLLLWFGFYNAGYRMLTNEISHSLYAKASYLTDTLEAEIGRIHKLQNECLNEETLYYNIGAFSIMTENSKITKLLDIQRRLKILHESSLYIDEVFVYIPGMNRKISSVDGVELVSNEEGEFLDMQVESMNFPLYYEQGDMYLGVSYPHNTDTVRLFTLFVRISETELKKELGFLDEYQDSGVKLVDCGGEYELTAGRDINLDGIQSTEGHWMQRVKDPDNSRGYTVLKVNSSYLNMDLFAYVSNETVYGDLYFYQRVFFACLVMMVIMMVGHVVSIHVVINSPIKILVNHLERMEQGDLGVRIEERREDEFGYVFVAFNRMAASLQNQMEINYRQKLLTQQAELRHLQSQINPHFLYNSFFTLYRMAKDEDCESMVEFSSYLSEYYRYITKNAQHDVELKAEVEHARRYAQIQAMRFSRRLSVKFEELPEQFRKIMVPRLILQPLLENAFEHGLKSIEKGGILHIWYEQGGGKLSIHVQDNGDGMTHEELEKLKESFRDTGEMIEDGLCNINRRLQTRFGEDFGLEIRSEEGKGTISSLVLPADSEEGKGEYVSSACGG